MIILDDKIIHDIFNRVWNRLESYSGKHDCGANVDIEIKDKESWKSDALSVHINLNRDELIKYIKEKANSVKLDKDIFVNKDDGVIEIPIYIEPNSRVFFFHINDDEYKRDLKNNLKYKISTLSLGASIQLLLKEKSEDKRKILIRRMFRPFSYIKNCKIKDRSLFGDDDKLKIKVLSMATTQSGHLFVVKIKDSHFKNIDFYKEYVNSLVFNMNLINYKSCSFRIVDNLSDYRDGHSKIIHYHKEEMSIPKLRYSKKLTDLYSAGSWTDNPFTAFINYYQVIEYFFNEIPDNRLFKNIRSKITSPLFSYNKKEDVIKLAEEIYKARQNDMNELHSLEAVLDHFLDVDMLKRLLDEKMIKVYSKEIPPFISSNKKLICFNVNSFDDNRNDNIDRLAQRIYSIRNALVHNKDNSQNNYNPQHHYKSLIKEVPLIRAIASSIIIKTGNPF